MFCNSRAQPHWVAFVVQQSLPEMNTCKSSRRLTLMKLTLMNSEQSAFLSLSPVGFYPGSSKGRGCQRKCQPSNQTKLLFRNVLWMQHLMDFTSSNLSGPEDGIRLDLEARALTVMSCTVRPANSKCGVFCTPIAVVLQKKGWEDCWHQECHQRITEFHSGLVSFLCYYYNRSLAVWW